MWEFTSSGGEWTNENNRILLCEIEYGLSEHLTSLLWLEREAIFLLIFK
jgi:hypothetical protein